eukprot:1147647-Prymnesium_polylepis.1
MRVARGAPIRPSPGRRASVYGTSSGLRHVSTQFCAGGAAMRRRAAVSAARQRTPGKSLRKWEGRARARARQRSASSQAASVVREAAHACGSNGGGGGST